MTIVRLMVPLLLVVFAVLAPHNAIAGTSCTAQVTNIEFGQVDANGTAVTATVDYSCRTEVAISALNEATVRMCFAIGAGSQPGSTINSRLMRNENLDPLSFQLYRNANPTQVWGNTVGVNTIDVQVSYPLERWLIFNARGRRDGSVTIQARIDSQTALAAGAYNTQFPGTALYYHYRDTLLGQPPSGCRSGGVQGTTSHFPFSASANVPHQCTISTATDLSFGSIPGLIDRPYDQTSSISLSCTRRTPWDIHLDNGQNAQGNARRMRMGADNYVVYELYRNPGRTQRWGTQKGVDTVPGTDEGSGQTVTVHGRVPAGQQVPAGEYRDTVTVTVTY